MDLNRLSPTGSNCGSQAGYVPPSRTHEYKKLMKPLMERKRRARMNMCIEEIRDLISGQLAAPGQRASRDDDLVSRMDKAEVLELAVKHIHKQLMSSRRPDPYTEVKMFHQGYLSARAIINDYLNSQQESDPSVLHRLNSHLDRLVTVPPAAAPLAAPLRVLPAPVAPLPTPTATLAPPILPRPQARPPPAVEAKLEKTDVTTPPASNEGPINLSKSAFRPVGSKSSTSASTSISSSSIDPNSWRPW